MEHGSIQREIHVAASPEIVFEVVSRPEHIREWWPDDARFDPAPGAEGELIWDDVSGGHVASVALTVLEVEPPRRFSFRWTHPHGEAATESNSLLVTFDLVPMGEGTTVRMTETGFREHGWEVAVLEQQYADHVTGWAKFIPQLGEYVARLVAA